MTQYYCPEDCKLQEGCSLKHPLPGDRFTNNPSDELCWCYLKLLLPLKKSWESEPRKCGNCSTWRQVHDGIVEMCPYCGDDEYEVSGEGGL
jgi:hypothetical protein